MERNVNFVETSDSLRNGARELVTRAAGMAQCMVEQHLSTSATIEKGGRKASAPAPPSE